MDKMHKACIVCKSQDIFQKYIIKGFHIFQCKQCALLFVAEQLSREELDTYSKNEIAGEQEFTYVDQDNIENLNFYYRRLAEMINQGRAKGKILDVGCSAGYFLDCMPGWERYGIEPVTFQAETARCKYPGNIHNGILEDCKFAPEYFDVITLQDSLDHMTDPVAAITKCRQLLKPGGLLVVKVHDISCLFGKVMGKKFYVFVPPFHLSYFNRKNLLAMLNTRGFKVKFYKYMTQVLFLKTVLFRMSQNNKKSIFYYLYTLLNRTPLKDIKMRKNLHDIITVFADKQ